MSFIRRHGVVLLSAKGPVPTLTEVIAGGRIRGSWWGHPKARDIYRVLSQVCDSPQIVLCRLLGGKITVVHRRLWPALVRLSSELGRERLAAIREQHTASGAHKTVRTLFPRWVPVSVRAKAKKLSKEQARLALGNI